MEVTAMEFSDSSPYPAIQVDEKSKRYAHAMLSNIGSRHSEISTITLYVYNSTITKEAAEDISHCFHKISIVEMHHLSIFAQLAYLLGADPRLWSAERKKGGMSLWHSNGYEMKYWNAGYNSYAVQLPQMLKNAIAGERKAIEIYRKQCEWIKDENIRSNLERIILDEELHVKILCQLHQECMCGLEI